VVPLGLALTGYGTVLGQGDAIRWLQSSFIGMHKTTRGPLRGLWCVWGDERTAIRLAGQMPARAVRAHVVAHRGKLATVTRHVDGACGEMLLPVDALACRTGAWMAHRIFQMRRSIQRSRANRGRA
jgi:hypothetical protein